MNILNKEGFLTAKDRKEKLQHGGDHLQFSSCIDLSDLIQVWTYGTESTVSIENYSKDLASFFSWWTENVLKDLNGFSGFSNLKFKFVNFTIEY